LDRTICFIDKDGMSGVCTIEGLSDDQIKELMGSYVIDCSKCSFYNKYKGKEKEEFSYTRWTGNLAKEKRSFWEWYFRGLKKLLRSKETQYYLVIFLLVFSFLAGFFISMYFFLLFLILLIFILPYNIWSRGKEE